MQGLSRLATYPEHPSQLPAEHLASLKDVIWANGGGLIDRGALSLISQRIPLRGSHGAVRSPSLASWFQCKRSHQSYKHTKLGIASIVTYSRGVVVVVRRGRGQFLGQIIMV